MSEELNQEPVVDQAAVDQTPSVDAIDTASDTPVDQNPADSTDVKDTEDVKPGEQSNPPHTEELRTDKFEYQGAMVDVVIPPDMANFAQEAGFDAMEIAKEMYSPEGLSEDTRNALNEAFGKWQVDLFLDGVAAKDAATMKSFTESQESAKAAAETAWNDTLELMGGEDRWADLSAYAEKNLSEDDIAEFNEVMKNGTLRMQKLMIQDLWSQFDSAGKPPAPAELDLEDGSNQAPASSGGSVSQAEYLASFQNGEYAKDPAGWDARRQAGIAKGI
jgi:hypothetical protein